MRISHSLGLLFCVFGNADVLVSDNSTNSTKSTNSTTPTSAPTMVTAAPTPLPTIPNKRRPCNHGGNNVYMDDDYMDDDDCYNTDAGEASWFAVWWIWF